MIFAARGASALAATDPDDRTIARCRARRDRATRALAGVAAAGALVVLLGSSDTFAAGAVGTAHQPSPAPRAVDSAAIVVNGILSGFEPSTVDLNPGGTLTVTNNDTMTHTFTSQAIDGNGDPLFDVHGAGRHHQVDPGLGSRRRHLRLLLPDPPADDRHADHRGPADGPAHERPEVRAAAGRAPPADRSRHHGS